MFLFNNKQDYTQFSGIIFKYIICSYSTKLTDSVVRLIIGFKYIICSYSTLAEERICSFVNLFKYIICSYSTINYLLTNSFRPLFKYIICSYSTRSVSGVPSIRLNLNTSYVPIQRKRKDGHTGSLIYLNTSYVPIQPPFLSPFSSPLSLKNLIFSTHFPKITNHNIHIYILFPMQGYFSIFCYFALLLLVRSKTYLSQKHTIYTAVSHSHFHIPPLPALR